MASSFTEEEGYRIQVPSAMKKAGKGNPELMFLASNSSVSRWIYHLQSYHWQRRYPSSEYLQKKVHFHTVITVKGVPTYCS